MKITVKSNFKVVIEPRGLGNYGFVRVPDDFFGKSQQAIEKNYQERCEEIIDQVKRHVDNVGWIGIEKDEKEICSHCGRIWEVSEDDSDPEFPKGTPLCCGKAIEEHSSNKNS